MQKLVLAGSGSGMVGTRVWTDNGDFPAGDTESYSYPALARSAVSGGASGASSVAADSGGGGSLSWLGLLLLAGGAVRRLHQ